MNNETIIPAGGDFALIDLSPLDGISGHENMDRAANEIVRLGLGSEWFVVRPIVGWIVGDGEPLPVVPGLSRTAVEELLELDAAILNKSTGTFFRGGAVLPLATLFDGELEWLRRFSAEIKREETEDAELTAANLRTLPAVCGGTVE